MNSSERLREREIDREREDRSGWRMAARSSGFRGGVEWAGGWWLVAARSATLSKREKKS